MAFYTYKNNALNEAFRVDGTVILLLEKRQLQM